MVALLGNLKRLAVQALWDWLARSLPLLPVSALAYCSTWVWTQTMGEMGADKELEDRSSDKTPQPFFKTAVKKN